MRLPTLTDDQMTEAQRRVAAEAAAGKRGHVPAPLRAWLHSPELGARAQRLGEFVRYDTVLGPYLSELAILVTARCWTAQYEWYAHKREALKAGVPPAVIDAIAAGQAPALDDPKARLVHDYARTLHQTRTIPEAMHADAVRLLGEQGVVDLVGVLGYYTLVAMTLNAFAVGLPDGEAPGLDATRTEALSGAHRFRLGAMEVTVLRDGNLPFAIGNLRGLAPDAITAVLRDAGAELSSDVNVVAVRHGGRTALIDAGGGTYMTERVGHLPASLRAAGIDPASVDTVLLTHFHSDHSYGLADAAGAALFPNATLRAAAAELGFWMRPGAKEAAPPSQHKYFDQVIASAAPYRDRTRPFEAGEEVFPGVTAVALPGHTPGHTGYRLRSGEKTLLVWGDVVHVPELQGCRPEVTVAFDVDPEAAIATRRAVLRAQADSGEPVIGMHTRFPGPVRVRAAADGYAMAPVEGLAPEG